MFARTWLVFLPLVNSTLSQIMQRTGTFYSILFYSTWHYIDIFLLLWLCLMRRKGECIYKFIYNVHVQYCRKNYLEYRQKLYPTVESPLATDSTIKLFPVNNDTTRAFEWEQLKVTIGKL